MRLGIALVVGLLAATPVAQASEPVGVPDMKVGDKWVMQGTDTLVKDNKVTSWKVRREVTKVEGTVATWKYEMLPPSKPTTGQNRYDFASQVILRDFVSGKPEPTRFPLVPGNEWTYEYEVKTSLGIVRNEMKAKVVGWEEVTVPAGTFRALRIEHQGKWSRDGDFARGEGFGQKLSAPVESIYWYAPAAKVVVKTTRTETSYYGGIWFRSEGQLVEFSTGNN